MLGSGRECTLFSQPMSGVRGWHLHAYNSVIGGTLEFMAPSTFTYAQNDGVDQLEFVSSDSGDTTQYITAYGIDQYSKKVSQNVILTGDTVVLSTDTWLYFENAWLDAEAAGTVTIQDEDNNSIAEIEIGSINTGIAQHFNGEEESYVTFFAGGLYDGTKDATYVLRWYPDEADCLDAGDGFEILDELYCPVESGHDNHVYPTPIGPLPKNGWLSVWAIADAASAKGWVTLQGFDVEK